QACEVLRAVERPGTRGLRMLLVEIIDDDQVEVGGRGHLTPAELAKRQQHDLLPDDAAVRLRKQVLDVAAKRADHNIGKAGESLRRLLRRYGSRQDTGADQEHVLLAEQAQTIEMVLVGLGLA